MKNEIEWVKDFYNHANKLINEELKTPIDWKLRKSEHKTLFEQERIIEKLKTKENNEKEKLKNNILSNIIKKCQSCSGTEVVAGKFKVIDRYYSIKDIEQVLKEIFNQGEL